MWGERQRAERAPSRIGSGPKATPGPRTARAPLTGLASAMGNQAFSRVATARLQRVKRETPYAGRTIYYETDDNLYYERVEGQQGAGPAYVLMDPQPKSVYLLGEGNFEYSKLLQARHADMIVKATELEDSADVLARPRARVSVLELVNVHQSPASRFENVADLENAIASERVRSVVQFGVDATRLDSGDVSPRRYSELRWIFPHAGGGASNPAAMQEYVARNGPILRDFFLQAPRKLNAGGVVKIALKQTPPYYYLDLFEMAKAGGFRLRHVKGFVPRAGFIHSRTGRQDPVPSTGETSYVFELLDPAEDPAALQRPAALPEPPPIPQQRAEVYSDGRRTSAQERDAAGVGVPDAGRGGRGGGRGRGRGRGGRGRGAY